MRKVLRGIVAVFKWLLELNEIVVDHLARHLSVVALVAAGVFAAWYVREVHASRNSSGTMAGINGPYTSGTVISSSILNARFADIENELTQSLERSGKGGMTAALRGSDGTVTAPAFSFTSETGTGLYRIGSSDLGLSINQTKTGEWTANGYRTANGAVATPSLSFFNDTGSGLYRAGSNDIRFAINGADVGQWTANGLRSANGAVTTPSLSFLNDTGSGLYRAGSNDLRFAVNGADKTFWNATGFGIGVAPLWKLHVQLASSGATAISSTSAMIESNGTHFLNLLAPNANSSGIAFGDVASPSNGYIEYKNSTNASANQMQFGAAGATKMVIGSGGLTIGASGTAIAQMNSGSCTTSGGTPSNCTATVASGAKCVATEVNTVNDSNMPNVSVASTTLTITTTNGATKTYNYLCF